MGAFLGYASQVATLLAAGSIVFAVIAHRREIRAQDLQALFYLHQYLSQEEFADARRTIRTRSCIVPFEEWTQEDHDAAGRVSLSFEEAGLLLGGGVMTDKGRRLMLQSAWGQSICDFYEMLDGFLSAKHGPTLTGREYFPAFTALYSSAAELHRGAAAVGQDRLTRFPPAAAPRTGSPSPG